MNLNLNKEAAQFSEAVIGYEVAYNLPMDLFHQPDHIAIRTADIKEFEELVKAVTNSGEEAFCLEEEEGFVVVAQMAGALSLGQGHTRWIEIKEPAYGEQDYIGLEHAGFYFRDMGLVEYILNRRNLDHEIEIDGEHKIISLPINELGQTIEIMDIPAKNLVTDKWSKGEATLLKAA